MSVGPVPCSPRTRTPHEYLEDLHTPHISLVPLFLPGSTPLPSEGTGHNVTLFVSFWDVCPPLTTVHLCCPAAFLKASVSVVKQQCKIKGNKRQEEEKKATVVLVN